MKKDKQTKTYKIIDLFSGCWGFSYGFEMSDFEVLVWVDNVQPALDVFKDNHKHADILNLDLSENKSIDTIVEKVKDIEVDVIIAWPPCQWFSLTWTRKEEDKRNKLFYSVFRLATRTNPKVIVIENVPWIATLYWGKAKEAILSEFERLWYKWKFKVLYAPEYWVPQIRKRMVFVGVRNDLGSYEFPSELLKPIEYITTSQAISDLHDVDHTVPNKWENYKNKPLSGYQKEMRKSSRLLYNHVWTNHTKEVIDVISQVPDWWNHKNLPKWVWESRKFNEAWTRYNSNKPSKTIDTWHRNHFHYKYNRIPSPRENARLQSFPDNFIFRGTKTQQYRMIWNAVPPLLWFALAKSIKEVLDKN